MYGFDIQLRNVKNVKGVSNCILNFHYSGFESCSFNAENSLVGGVFTVIESETNNHDNALQQLSSGITIVSQKKNYQVLCDGRSQIHLKHDESIFSDIPFEQIGTCDVTVPLLYNNKGSTRIKAGDLSLSVSLFDLCKPIHTKNSALLDKIRLREERDRKLREYYLQRDKVCGNGGNVSEEEEEADDSPVEDLESDPEFRAFVNRFTSTSNISTFPSHNKTIRVNQSVESQTDSNMWPISKSKAIKKSAVPKKYPSSATPVNYKSVSAVPGPTNMAKFIAESQRWDLNGHKVKRKNRKW